MFYITEDVITLFFFLIKHVFLSFGVPPPLFVFKLVPRTGVSSKPMHMAVLVQGHLGASRITSTS